MSASSFIIAGSSRRVCEVTTTGSSVEPDALLTSDVMPAPGSGPACTMAHPDTHVRRMSGQCLRLNCTEKVTLREQVRRRRDGDHTSISEVGSGSGVPV